jgi:hypothetical protein
MLTRIRDLDFDVLIGHVVDRIDRARRRGCTMVVNMALLEATTPEAAVMTARNAVLVAALRHTTGLDELTIERPLVEAVVRFQHHPLARPLPDLEVRDAVRGPSAAPRLTELANAHPELGWDADAVPAAILRELRDAHGDHELDDAEPPWLMHWDAASPAFSALMVFVTLRALGDL